MTPLPIESCAAIARIEALVAEAERLGTFGDQELAFAFRQTQRRYLPDTINAYLKIPESHRDEVAQTELLRQLLTLERATRDRLAVLAAAGRKAQETNGTFLYERFGKK